MENSANQPEKQKKKRKKREKTCQKNDKKRKKHDKKSLVAHLLFSPFQAEKPCFFALSSLPRAALLLTYMSTTTVQRLALLADPTFWVEFLLLRTTSISPADPKTKRLLFPRAILPGCRSIRFLFINS